MIVMPFIDDRIGGMAMSETKSHLNLCLVACWSLVWSATILSRGPKDLSLLYYIVYSRQLPLRPLISIPVYVFGVWLLGCGSILLISKAMTALTPERWRENRVTIITCVLLALWAFYALMILEDSELWAFGTFFIGVPFLLIYMFIKSRKK